MYTIKVLFGLIGWTFVFTLPGTAGLLWYSPLDGNANAVAGSDGTLVGNPAPAADRDGNSGKALEFDQVDDYVDFGAVGTLTAGTLSTWVNLSSLADNQVVLAAGGRDDNQVFFLVQADLVGGAVRWRGDLDDGSSRREVFSDSNLLANNWVHVTLAFTAQGQLTMYVNGLQQAAPVSLSANAASYPMTNNGLVGAGTAGDRLLGGVVDDAGVWNEELTARHIALIHGLGLFHGLPLDAPEIATADALTTVGQTLVVDGTTWEYVSGLTGPTGATGGSLAGQDAFIVLNGTSNEGLRIYAGPITAPSVITLPAINIGTFLADVRGAITETGNQSPETTIYYGLSDRGTNAGLWDYGVVIGPQSGTFYASLDTLDPGTRYYFRCFAENSAGSAWAPSTEQFDTLSVDPAQVSGIQVGNLSGYAATLSGTVTDDGGDAPNITVHYGESPGGTDPLAWDQSQDFGVFLADFQGTLTGLDPDTSYHCAVVASNYAGVVWFTGPDFTTPDLAPVWINEFMAANDTTVVPNAVEGQFDDWIELYNAESSVRNLAGWHMTDRLDRLTKWTFPAGSTIPAGGYLVVFASGDDEPDANGNLHTSFKLSADGDYVALVNPALEVVSEFEAGGTDFPDQDPDISYGLSPTDSAHVYFSVPTPLAANDPNGFLPVRDTKFSPDRGFFDHPTNVVITTSTSGAQIYYTTDGREPTTGDTLYSGPVPISQTTVVRARAYRTGYQPTDVDTHTYILMDTNVVDPGSLNQVLTQTQPPGYDNLTSGDYNMDTSVSKAALYEERLLNGLQDIPTLSVSLPSDDFSGSADGIYTHSTLRGFAWERACSAEFIDPLDPSDAWGVSCGLRVQGGASRNPSASPKHSLSLRFRDTYGPSKLNKRLFPDSEVTDFNVISLRAGYNNSWIHRDEGQRGRASMIRDQWVRDAMLDMGNKSAGHGFLIHLYVNGLYWGVHNLCERPDASHYAEYNDADDETIYARNGSDWVDNYDGQAAAAWSAMQATAASGDWTAIQAVIKVDNYIDYQIINRYGGNADLKSNGNWRSAGGGPDNMPWELYCWDSERTLEGESSITDPLDPMYIRGYMDAIAEYKVRFGDRLHKHFFNGGALTAQVCADRWMHHATQIDRAIVAESARWGDHRRTTPYTRDAEWLTEQNRLLNQYFPVRSGNVIDRYQSQGFYPYLDAPTYNQHGGIVSNGFELVVNPAPGETMVVTFDGSDPRLEGGAPQPGVLTLTSAFITNLVTTTKVKARHYQSGGGTWSALTDAVFLVGAPGLRITEVMYHPAVEAAEYVEIHNAGATEVSLYGVRLRGEVDYDFSLDTPPLLQPGGRIVVYADQAAFESVYGTGIQSVGPWAGILDNAGDDIHLDDAVGDRVVTLAYDSSDGWPKCADGAGHSLVPLDQSHAGQSGGALAYAGHWRASAYMDGSPGQADPDPVRDICLNEIQAHTDYPAPYYSNDSLELYNLTNTTVVMSEWYLSDEAAVLDKWRIPPTTMVPGDWAVFSEVGGFNDNPPGSGFGLNKAGETVYLSYLPTVGPQRVADWVTYPAAENSVSWGRYADGSDDFYYMPETLDAANALNAPTGLRITEVMYHPPATAEHGDDSGFFEFIEIFNPGSGPVLLESVAGSWRVSGEVDYTFPAGTTLAAGQYLLLVHIDPLVATEETEFRTHYGLGSDPVAFHGPYSGSLSNKGGRLRLERPQEGDLPGDPVSWVRIDQVDYFEQSPWDAQADGFGDSLHRGYEFTLGTDPANWYALAPSPAILPLPVSMEIVTSPAAMTLQLQWQAEVGRLYLVEACEELCLGSWVPVGTHAGGGAVVYPLPIDEGTGHISYRLKLGH